MAKLAAAIGARCQAAVGGRSDGQCSRVAVSKVERCGVEISLCTQHDRALNAKPLGNRYGTRKAG